MKHGIVSAPLAPLGPSLAPSPVAEIITPIETSIEQRQAVATNRVDATCRVAYREVRDALPPSFRVKSSQLASKYQGAIDSCLEQIARHPHLNTMEKSIVTSRVTQLVGAEPDKALRQTFRDQRRSPHSNAGWSILNVRTLFQQELTGAKENLETTSADAKRSLEDLSRNHDAHQPTVAHNRPATLGDVAVALTNSQSVRRNAHDQSLDKLDETPAAAAQVDAGHAERVDEIEIGLAERLEQLKATILANPGEDIRHATVDAKIKEMVDLANAEIKRLIGIRRNTSAADDLAAALMGAFFGGSQTSSFSRGAFGSAQPAGHNYPDPAKRPPTADELAQKADREKARKLLPDRLTRRELDVEFRKLSRTYHPDVAGPADPDAEEKYKSLTERHRERKEELELKEKAT